MMNTYPVLIGKLSPWSLDLLMLYMVFGIDEGVASVSIYLQ